MKDVSFPDLEGTGPANRIELTGQRSPEVPFTQSFDESTAEDYDPVVFYLSVLDRALWLVNFFLIWVFGTNLGILLSNM